MNPQPQLPKTDDCPMPDASTLDARHGRRVPTGPRFVPTWPLELEDVELEAWRR